MDSSQEICSAEEFEYFMKQRHLLTENDVDGKWLRSKSADSTVGLINHGSTCYLNSILQCLLQNSAFLKALFASNSENSDNAIVKELKRLISFMVHSIRSAVGTKDLLTSFGWNESQIHDQHDAQEFYGILLDALSQSSPLLEGKLHQIFRGSDSDSIQCTECQFEKTNDSFYQCLSVEVPDHLEGKQSSETHSLTTLLCDLLKTEVLDESNRWECSSCNKKVCANRRHNFKSLPETVAIHLKRFRFDPTTKKRRKLNTSIEFQEQYNFLDILQPNAEDSSSGLYQLSGVVLHLGTAMGGHYKTFVRSLKDSNLWWECNDDNIHKCTDEEIATLFLSANNAGSVQQPSIMENAYVLFYSKVGGDSSSDYYSMIHSLIPSTPEIEKDNESFETLVKLSNIQRKIYHFDVQIYRVNEISAITPTLYGFDFPKQSSLQEITTQVYNHLTSNGVISPEEYSLSNVRIRKFSNTRNSKGETYDSRLSLKLSETNFLLKELICFEIRKDSDPTFIEYNPNEMLLSFYLWDSTTSTTQEIEGFIQTELLASKEGGTVPVVDAKWIELTVPGLEKATVAQLKTAVREKFGFAADDNSFHVIPFIQNSNIPLTLIEDLSSELRKKYSIFPGSKIFIEKFAGESTESKILTILKSYRSKMHLFFNNPKNILANDTDLPEYTYEVETTSDITLLQLKELIKSKLNLSESVEDFYLKQNKDGNQYKQENKTLDELGITDQSIIHVNLGKGCKNGEYFIRFELDIGRLLQLAYPPNAAAATAPAPGGVADANAAMNNAYLNRYILLDEVPVNEKSTILSMKKLLFAQWEQLAKTFHDKFNALPNKDELSPFLSNLLLQPQSLHHIRLRDYKNGKISGPLRDDRMICRCLLGLSDGRRIILQILPNEEIIGPDDLLITIRYVSFYYTKLLSDSYDISIPRSFKIKDLYEKLIAYFPQLIELPAENFDAQNNILNSSINKEENNYVEIAKGFTTGPPLTLKSSLKLKWELSKLNIFPAETAAPVEGGPENIGDTVIDRPPLNLRDGAILVLRNHYDYLKAQEVSQQKMKEKAEAEGEIGVGGGISAVRAKAMNSSQKRPGSSAGRYLRPGSSASSSRGMRGSSTEPMLKIVTHDKNSRPPLPDGSNKSIGFNGSNNNAQGSSPNENIANNSIKAGAINSEETLPEPSPTKML